MRFWLPRGQEDDIIAELSEDLRAQIADQEAALARPLETAELETLLKQCGHPLRVAGRFLPQQQLIGQPWYPPYLFTLKLVVLWIQLPLLAVISVPLVLTADHPLTRLADCFNGMLSAAVTTVGIITVIFAVLERLQVKIGVLDNWNPRSLPKLVSRQDPMRIPRGASFGAFAGLMAITLVWMGALQLYPGGASLPFRLLLSDAFYWPVLLFLIAEMAMNLVNLVLPWWTRRRAALRLLSDIYGIALGIALTLAWPWFELRLLAAPADQVAMVQKFLNWTVLPCLGFGILSYLLRAWQDSRRALGKPPLRNPLVLMFTN
ncbi:MAG TPA: hypothetical protein VGS99_08220 [Gammaproteobacteria bacterium]|nr:hypothetical protein [Gammaproteobacteria bacterium]